MGVELLEIGVKMRKGVIFSIKGCFRSVCYHPFLVGALCFLLFLYRSSPFMFQLLVSAFPILVCTAVLLGALLSLGQPNIPEIEIEEKTVEAVSIRSRVVEENESHYVERFGGNGVSTEEQELLSGKVGEVRREENSDDTAPLLEESEVSNGDSRERKGELADLRFKVKTELIEERLDPHSSDAKVNGELIEPDDDKSQTDSFDSEKVNVDSLDSPPRSPWARVEDREDEEAELENEHDEDEDEEASDSGSDCSESSSPDASMADIMPMLDELHPLLDEEAPQIVHLSRSSSDAASEKFIQSSAGSHQSDNDPENRDDLEAADDGNEEDAQGDKDEETKSAITWTEEDQKNLMELGSSEIERNLRLENLILKRRAGRNTSLLAERNLIDFESSDLPSNIAPISTRRKNPFDLPQDDYDNSELPPIPGSAPSVLLPRRNPFDIPYDSSEEKPDLTGHGVQEEFTSQSNESFFRRHESFSLGRSIFVPKKENDKMRPYFVSESIISEESSSALFQRQSSELSDSKVSSVPESESITSVEDLDEVKLPEIDRTKEVTEEGPSGDTEMIFQQEIETEGVYQEQEIISKVDIVSEHNGHGIQSLEEENSLELSRVENPDVQVGESQLENARDRYEQGERLEVQGFRHDSDFEAVEPSYTRVSSSSSSLSEVSERVFIDTEGEARGVEEPSISSQTSLRSSDLNITSTSVNTISQWVPLYDSSPQRLSKNVSSSSIASDVLPQFDLGFAPVLDRMTMSSSGSESEIETGIPRNIEMLHDASTSHPVVAESTPVDVVNIREHDTDILGTDQISIGKSSSPAVSFVPHTFIPLESSGETLEEEHTLDKVSISIADKNIHSVDAVDESIQSPTPDADIQDEAGEKMSNSMLSPEGNTSISYDNSIQEPDFNYLNDMQASSTPTELILLDGPVTQDLNSPENQELLHFINSVPFPPSAFEMNTPPPVDVQTVVEEADEIKEIDGFLSELDSIGDFSVGQFGSGTSALGKNVDCVEEESLSSTHHAETSTVRANDIRFVEVNEMEHLLHSEESRENVNVYEQDLEQIADILTYQKSKAENIEVSRNEFDESDHYSPYQETSVEETLLIENDVLVYHNHEGTVSGVAIENVGTVAKLAELALIETEVTAQVAEVSCQGRVGKDAPFEMPELQASSIQDIDLAFKQISSEESKKRFTLDSPIFELQNHEETICIVPESDPGMTELEVSTVEDIDLAFTRIIPEVIKKPLVLEQVDTIVAFQMPELEATETEDIDLAPNHIISTDNEKHVSLEPPLAKLCHREEYDSGITEQEVQLEEAVHTVFEHIELASVGNEIIMEDAVVSSQGQVKVDNTSAITEIETSAFDLAFKQNHSEEIEKPIDLEPLDTDETSGMPETEASSLGAINLAIKLYSSKGFENHDVLEPVHTDATSRMPEIEATSVEALNMAFKNISSEEIKNDDGLEPVHTDTSDSSGMLEIEASSIKALNLAFEHIGSEDTMNCDALEPLRIELVVGESITENSEDRAPHRDTILRVSTNEASVLEVGPSKDAIWDDTKLDDSITGIITENSEDVVPHLERSVVVSTSVTPIVEVGPNQDAISVQHVVEAIPSEDTMTPNQVFDGETTGQLKLESDDEQVKVKADNRTGPSEEESNTKESSGFEAKKPNCKEEAPNDLHSPSPVEGKGNLHRSSSSSSSSSSNPSLSDSDKE